MDGPARIRELDIHVVDKIAAGEVLERPSNLVKELIENSLDSAATEIEVHFDEGGRHIQVRDNGWGISALDLPLALKRHATSKISSAEDLWALHSYGFRGEALASIAAVSRLSVVSRPRAQELAGRIISDFGTLGPVEDISGQAGTTVLVDQLFENVPARLKFLKSEGAEGIQIKRVVKAQALAHPQVSFRIFQKSKLLMFWPAVSNSAERARQIFKGHSIFDVTGEESGIHVRAHLGTPDDVERTSQDLWIFVQNRWVTEKTIQAAVMESYRHLLMHGEFPRGALFVDVDPQNVDVNVHPAKSQIKFQNNSVIFRAVHHVLRDAIEKAPWSGPALVAEGTQGPVREDQNLALFVDTRTQFAKKSTFDIDSLSRLRLDPTETKTEAPRIGVEPFWGRLDVLGQANLTYVVAQSNRALILIDQHAAHERVAFERLMKSWKAGSTESQNLLVPLILHLPEGAAEILVEHRVPLECLGLDLDQIGVDQVAIRSIPSLLKETAVAQALRQMADEAMTAGGSFRFERAVTDVLATMACHSVVRAGQVLSKEEMGSLLVQMDEFPLSSFCPHGRPVFYEMSFNELDRSFGRIV